VGTNTKLQMYTWYFADRRKQKIANATRTRRKTIISDVVTCVVSALCFVYESVRECYDASVLECMKA
jgi:hypothetical protein